MSESIKPALEERITTLEDDMNIIMDWMKTCAADEVGTSTWHQRKETYNTKKMQLDELHEELLQQQFENNKK